MTDLTEYFTGDEIVIDATLEITRNGVTTAQDLTNATLIQAALVKANLTEQARGTTTVSCTIVGDPVLGQIQAIFPQDNTGLIDPGIYYLEVQATISTKRFTWKRVQVKISKGLIQP